MIVIDSNQLLGMPPGSPSWILLRVVGERTGHSLAISEITLWEVLSNVRRHFAEDVAALNRSRDKLSGRLASYAATSINWPDDDAWLAPEDEIDEAIRRYEDQLRQRFRILQTPGPVAVEALRREAWRLPPCAENGRGGRDSAIWLTAAAAAADDMGPKNRPMPLLFVSNDGGFVDPGGGNRLRSTLIDDLPNGVAARLCRNITDVFTEIGQPADGAALQPMLSHPTVIQALINTIFEKAFPNMPEVRKFGFAEGNCRIVTIGELLQADRASFDVFHGTPAACTAAGQSWLCANGTWIFSLPLTDLSDLGQYALNEMVAGSPRGLEITATLVLAFTADHSITQVQIVDFWADAPLRPAILVKREEHRVTTMAVQPRSIGEWDDGDLNKVSSWEWSPLIIQQP
jgi:hypothetical protein